MNEEDPEYDLEALQEAANRAIAAARSQNQASFFTVNWGDLNCTDAQKIFHVDGTITYRVEIEEAAPDSHGFREWVQNYLTQHGFPGVSIATEW